MEKQHNPKTQSEYLDMLLSYVSPAELRKSVQKTLFAYQMEQDGKGLDAEFKQVVECQYFLIEFLDKLASK